MNQYSWTQGLSLQDPSQLFDLGIPNPQPSNHFDFGSLGPFAFNFASQPLPSISSFGAFPDFRHHPLVLPQGDGSRNGGGFIEKPVELASSVPAFNFAHKRRPICLIQSTHASSPRPPQQKSPPAPGSPLSQGSSSQSGSSRSPSSSLSPTIAPEYGLPSFEPIPVQHFDFNDPQPTFARRPSPLNHSPNRPSSYDSSSSSSSYSSQPPNNDHTALDILAVAAQSSLPPPPDPTPFASLSLEELQRRHQEQQQKINAGLKREREQGDASESAKKKKKRIGRGLDPGKTRMLIFPPTLPSRSFTPLTEAGEGEGYVKRSVPDENLYAPRWFKGKDSRTRVAFCEYCGEASLPTRMSGYGYHLLHTHNLSSHSPYLMPAPLRTRTLPTPHCPATIIGREEACSKASPSLEGECPFTGEGGEGRGKCALGGWHKLNGFREAMNAHLGGKGLSWP